jgi:hypothetical protein
MCIHTGREEEESSKGVCIVPYNRHMELTSARRAKYIEGLENRLGRMEALLKMSGLLSEEDAGKTDLGTLERKLAEKSVSNGDGSRRNSLKPSNGTDSHHSTPRNVDMQSSPRTSIASPGSEKEKEKEKEAEVEALSDMMCSLVTNNCGETRYIGTLCRGFDPFV